MSFDKLHLSLNVTMTKTVKETFSLVLNFCHSVFVDIKMFP